MQTVIIALIIFLPIILVVLTIVLISKIVKVLSQKTRKQKTRKPSPLSQDLNTAEIIFTVFFLVVLVILYLSLPKQYSFITNIYCAGYSSLFIYGWQQKQQKNKYPTIEDIRRKYPKRKPIETPTDGIYEDFSREVIPLQSEAVVLEISENSYKALLAMLYGNTETAEKLIKSNLCEGKSATWACEKAIHDLESDRR